MKYLEYYLIGGLVLAGGGAAAFFMYKKKKEEEELLKSQSSSTKSSSTSLNTSSNSKASTKTTSTETTKKPTTPTKYPSNGTVTGNNVNVRLTASTSKAAVYTLKKGQEITVDAAVTGESVKGNNIWYKFRTTNGDRYIHSSYVSNFKVLTDSKSEPYVSPNVRDIQNAAAFISKNANTGMILAATNPLTLPLALTMK